MNRSRVALLAAAAVLAQWSGSARADFTVCNQTSAKLSLAMGYKEAGKWVSAGWWNLDVGACQAVVPGVLANRFYYIRAEAPGRRWEGEYDFCYRNTQFKIIGDDKCRERGYGVGAFFEVDTGNSADHTATLTD